MASRYPTTPVFDYCFNPIHVVDDSKDVIVPCGKCDGCRLHKANEWSMRLASEIESCPFPVFTTLTYSNKYLPKLKLFQDKYDKDFNCWSWKSDHDENVRLTLKFTSDGIKTVEKVRDDNIVVNGNYFPIPITNYGNSHIPYASKRDFQLYLKLIRKLIYEQFPEKTAEAKRIRYHCISEYGETLYRPHLHVIFFFYDEEVSTYFIEYLVYACWQMCDKTRITDYTQYCDGRASSYLTQYVNSVSRLPKVYREVKELRPWRLASKSFAIGYNNFSKEQVSESIIAGNYTFRKPVVSLGKSIDLRFPKGYISSVFPKSYEFGKSTYNRKLRIYGLFYAYMSDKFLCRQCRHCDYSSRYDCVSVRLRSYLHTSDYIASKACWKYCLEFGCVPEHYLYVLDMAYYKQAMFSLKMFYEYQQKLADKQDWLSIGRLYSNFHELCTLIAQGDDWNNFIGRLFLESLSLDVADIDTYSKYDLYKPSLDFETYRLEVDDILKDMVKLPKFNEMTGTSPNNY